MKNRDSKYKEFANLCLDWNRKFVESCKSFRKTSNQLFDKIILANQDTEFGRKYAFRSMASFSEFRDIVPIQEYAEIKPWINRILQGERKVLTMETPYMMLKTSGTTAEPKLIPQTKGWRSEFRGPAIYSYWGAYINVRPFIVSGSEDILDMAWERDTPKEFVAGFPCQSITHRPTTLGSGDWEPPWYDAPWIDFTNNDIPYFDRLYLRLRYFCDKNLKAIVCVNPSTLIALAHHLEMRSEELIREIRDGTLFGKPCFLPNRDLANNLSRICNKQNHLKPQDVWPQLSLVICWKSGSCRLYLPLIHETYSKDIEILPFSATSTEGVVTLPIDADPTSAPLAVTQGLYEFVPCDSDETIGSLPKEVDTLLGYELETGRAYSLVMTQANGLYRYDTGDVYRVVGWFGDVPRLEFLNRRGAFTSFTGEKLTEEQVVSAFKSFCGKHDLEKMVRTNMFTVCPVWSDPPYYAVLSEVQNGFEVNSMTQLQNHLDSEFERVNFEYKAKRESGRLGPIRLIFVPPGTFQFGWNKKLASGVSGAQIKFRWLQKDDSLLRECLVSALGDSYEKSPAIVRMDSRFDGHPVQSTFL